MWAHGTQAREAFPTLEPGLDNPYVSVSPQVNACDLGEQSENRQGDKEVTMWPHRTWLILVHNIHRYHNRTELCPEGHVSPTVLTLWSLELWDRILSP